MADPKNDKGDAWTVGADPDVLTAEDTCTADEIEQSVRAFLLGDINLAQLEGFMAEDLYAVADTGYQFYQEGKYEEALSLFRGLLNYNPNDPYFWGMLGAIYQRKNNPEEAIWHYRQATDLYPEDVSSWANMGEMMIQESGRLKGKGEEERAAELFQEAVAALQKAIELDPEGENPSSLRARGVVAAAVGILQTEKKAS